MNAARSSIASSVLRWAAVPVAAHGNRIGSASVTIFYGVKWSAFDSSLRISGAPNDLLLAVPRRDLVPLGNVARLDPLACHRSR